MRRIIPILKLQQYFIKCLFAFVAFLPGNLLVAQTNVFSGPQSGLWTLAGSPYIIYGNVTVPAEQTLIIQPGCKVLISNSSTLNVQGRLIADGTPSDSIYFYGQKQGVYSYGGNISIGINSWGTSFSYVNMDSLGSYSLYAQSSFSLVNSIIRNSGGSYNIYLNSDTIKPVIQNCLFSGNESSRTIYGNAGSVSNITNNTNTIISVNGSVKLNSQWQKAGFNSYYSVGSSVVIDEGKTLTIQPGCKVSIPYNGYLIVNGTLVANGTVTDSIYFYGQKQSVYNYGGYFNFSSSSTNSSLSYVSLDSLGYNTGFSIIAYRSFSLTNSAIKNTSSNYSIYFNSDTISPVIQNCIFSGNDASRTIYSSAGSVSKVTSNTNAIISVNGSVSHNSQWPKAGFNSYYSVGSSVVIDEGKTLSIQPGCKVSILYNGYLIVNGKLVANGTVTDSIYFYGQKQSVYHYGGYINFSMTSSNSSLMYVGIDSLGYNTGYSIAASRSFSLINSTVKNTGSSYSILLISDTISPVIQNCIFSGNEASRTISSNLGSVSKVTNNINAVISINGSLSQNSIWQKAGLNSYFKLGSNVTIEVGKTLTIQSGCKVVIPYSSYFLINGTLIANGTASDSIYFYGQKQSVYNYGGYFHFSSSSTNSSLNYVSLDSLGYNTGYSIIAYKSFSLTNSIVKNTSSSYSIFLNSDTISPLIQNCTFNGNEASRTIYASAGSVSNITNNTNAIISLYGSMSRSSQWQKPGINSYFKLSNNVIVNTGRTLTIQPGCRILMPFNSLFTIDGTLVADGTPTDSIYFYGQKQSLYNYGGYFNFSSSSTNSSLSYISLDSLGYNTGYSIIAYRSFSLKNSAIKNTSSNYSIYFNSDTISPIIKNCIFNGNGASRTVYASAKCFSNVANNTNAILKPYGSINSNVVWPKQNANSYYQLDGAVTVNLGSTLTIEPGSIVNLSYSSAVLSVNGTLRAVGTETAAIRFLKITGTGSGAYGGGVFLNSGSNSHLLNYCTFDKLGYNGYALGVNTSDASVSNISVSNSQSYGIYISDASPTISYADITNNPYGIYVASGQPVFRNCKIYDNTVFGVSNASSATTDTVDARNCYWGDTTGPYHPGLNSLGTGNKVSDKVKFVPWIHQLITVDQIINLATIEDKYAEDTVTLNATASSGLPISYSISTIPSSGVAILAGNAITFLGDTGRVTVSVTQAGNQYYNPVTIQAVFKVTKHNQSITFNQLPAKIFGDAPFAVRATASSGLPVTFSIVSGPATINQDSVISLTGLGTVTIQANQAGSAKYFAATPVQSSFTVYPKSPDFAVQSVTSNQANLAPNDTVTVSWQVANIGRASSPVNWTERIYMQATNGTNRTLIQQLIYIDNSSLDTGQIISRSAHITIPAQLNVGDSSVFVVEIVPGSAIQEIPGTAANNIGIQQTPWNIKKLLRLTLSGNQITEGSANGIIAIVNRTGSLTNTLSVNISLSHPERLIFPSSVTIPAGQAGNSFTILAPDNNVIEGIVNDTISGTAPGFQATKDTISVIDNDNATLSIVNLPLQATEGDTIRFKVTTSLAPTTPLPVYLTSGNQVRFPVPASVIIPKDSLSATITVILPQNNIPEVNLTVRIAAGAANRNPADTTIQINDNDLPNLELVLQTNTISESAGLYATQATLRRTAASNTLAFTANLSANTPNTLIMPATVSLAAGENEKSFTVGAVDNMVVDSLRPVIITASVFVSSCGCSAPPASAGSVSVTLNVSDNDGASLTLATIPQTLPEGSANAGMLRVSRNTSTADSLLVNLSSSDTSEAIIPATIVIPAGQPFVNVPITTVNDGIADGNQTVFFHATAAGFSQGSVWAVVTDLNKPDLLIPAFSLNSNSIQTGAIFNYLVSVKNAGSVTAPRGVLVRGYLSQDTIIDNSDSIISNDIISAPIPAGQTLQVVNAVMAPDRPGQYKMLFKVNPDLTLTEFITTNNTSVPINLTIVPDYTATANVNLPYFLKGTTIPITGLATKTNGTPAINKHVEIFVITSGLRRKFFATTDTTGHYTAQFIPLANEAGHYTVGASYPNVNDTIAQDAFDILGVQINGGVIPKFSVQLSDTLRGKLLIRNSSSTPLTNFTLSAALLPNGAYLKFSTIALLAGNGSDSISYKVSGSSFSSGRNYELSVFNIMTTQGIVQSQNFYYYCYSPLANIVASISNININVSQGNERQVEFKLVNRSATNSGNITISLPQVNWLTSVTPKVLPSLAPGDTAIVILKFLGLAEVPVDYPITGNIGIAAQNGNGFTLPYRFQKVASTTGTVKVIATDEYTYYTAGGPKLGGAQVLIKQYYTGTVAAQGLTNSNGEFIATIPEGNYYISVGKDKHKPYSNTLIVNPGDTNSTTAFLSYQAITFSWNVVPTALQDQYYVRLNTQFETNVPKPVVIIDMPDSLPALASGQTYPFTITLTNHGLITAEDVQLIFPDDPDYEYVTSYQTADLGSHQSIQVPVLLKKRVGTLNVAYSGLPSYNEISQALNISSPMGQGAGEGATNCSPRYISVPYKFKCNATTGQWEVSWKQFQIGVSCPGGGGGGGIGGSGTGGGGISGGGIGSSSSGGTGVGGEGPVWYALCNTCNYDEYNPPPPPPPIINTLKNCNLPFCIKQIMDAIKAVRGNSPELKNCIQAWRAAQIAAASSESGVGLVVFGGIAIYKGYKCYKALKDIYDAIRDLIKDEHCRELLNAIIAANGGQRTATQTNPQISVIANYCVDLIFLSDVLDRQDKYSREYFGNLIDNDAWDEIAEVIRPYILHKDSIPQQIQNSILNNITGYSIQIQHVTAFFTRWNTSITALNNNILSPNAQYPDIINWTNIAAFEDSSIADQAKIQNAGFDFPFEMYDDRYEKLMDFVNQQKEGVCASVSVQFSQQLTMTREAFEGTLKIFNGHPTDAMDSLSVNIQITDQNGVPSNGLFEIQTASLDSLANVTGTGVINAQGTGSVKFLFIPEQAAAPQTPKVYKFGGSVRYWDPYVGAITTFPLASVPITVNPSPNLMLHYFMERSILGDDALTSPDIEPSIPAELAVMVQNEGYGPAVNMTISSAQPKIVDNEKGLAIDFNLVGSNFQGQPANMGVTNINFHTIPPLQTRIGQWYFTSSLLGKFVSYQADVVHESSYGNPDLSLVKGVKLHELTRSIREYGAQDDGINDFLVNDIFDVNDNPDIIYFSQGMRTAKVYPATAGSFSLPVSPPSFTNMLTVTASDTGWNYIKLNDPGNRLYDLVSVTRSDGQVIPINNAWLTFVTLPVSRSPIYENRFHIVDSFRTMLPVTYTVVWKPKNLNVPKIDSINGIPQPVTSNQVQNVKVVFNKRIDPATFTYQDITLTFQGGPNIMDSSIVITRIDTATFNVDLSAITTGNGLYTLTAQAANVTDLYGITGSVGKQVSWTQFLTIPYVQAFQGIPANHIAASYNKMQLLFNLPINDSSVTPARFTITKNGVLQNGTLIIDSVKADHKLFYLSGLGNILTQSGDYILTVDLPNVKSLNNVFGIQPQSITLTVDNTGPVLLSLAKSDSGGIDSQHFPFVKIKFNEDVVGFNTTAVQLTRNGQVLSLNIAQLSNTDLKTWTAGNFGMLTYPEGDYTFKIKLDSIRDAAGNKGVGVQQIVWTVDRSALIVTTPVITHDLGFSNADGITSGQSFNVAFHVSDSVSHITIYQFDLSGETALAVLDSAAAGNVSVPVTLLTGGNTGIRVKATGINGRMGIAEKSLFVDQVALTAQWLFSSDQIITRQPDTIALSVSSKLLSDNGFLNAIQFRKNGVLAPTTGLSFQRLNDTVYHIYGLRQVSSTSGNYDLSFNLQPFRKYSSGRNDSSTVSVSWIVQTNNHAPIANAGIDIVLAASGSVTLNGTGSSDPDADPITYRWIAPAGIILSDSTSATPTFTIPTANHGLIYSFLLIVSDGSSFATDVVNIILTPTICPGADTYFTLPKPGDGYTYQWQVDSTGGGFVNLIANTIHSGVNSDTLYLQTPSTSTYGYKYKCTATKGSFIVHSAVYTLKFAMAWQGIVSTAWENPANWSCGVLPDEHTDVIIKASLPHSLKVNSNAVCRSITVSNSATVTVSAGYNLDIKGKR